LDARGAVYFYRRTATNTWGEEYHWSGHGAGIDTGSSGEIGRDVTMKGDVIIVGAFQEHHPIGSYADAGTIYVLLRTDTNTWEMITKIYSLRPTTNGHFGKHVALDEKGHFGCTAPQESTLRSYTGMLPMDPSLV
jgi:hypothetical protein